MPPDAPASAPSDKPKKPRRRSRALEKGPAAKPCPLPEGSAELDGVTVCARCLHPPAAHKPVVLPVGDPDVPMLAQDLAYEVEVMDRRLLKKYPFNPRRMEQQERENLREILKDGLAQPAVVWNKRNGQLVGGHQRLRELDALHGDTVYRLRVCIVALDEGQHAEKCAALNNPHAQGDWDFDMLVALTKKPGFRAKAAGYDDSTYYNIFGAFAESTKQGETSLAISSAMQKAEERMTHIKRVASVKTDIDFYDVFIYENEAQRASAHDLWGLPFDKRTGNPAVFHNGLNFMRDFREFLEWRAQRPARTLGERVVASARAVLEHLDPMRPEDMDTIPSADMAILRGYVEQIVTALKSEV